MSSIAVFCGSASGKDPVYAEAAVALGRLLAGEGIRLVYGGAQVGLMGILADTVLENGGDVTGVIPGFMEAKEIAHKKLTQLVWASSMHERKYRMQEMADGIMALPGGYGTLDELFEMLTWAQLGLHHKPVGILNVAGFYDPLLRMADDMTQKGFLQPENRGRILTDAEPAGLLYKMKRYAAPYSAQHMGPEHI